MLCVLIAEISRFVTADTWFPSFWRKVRQVVCHIKRHVSHALIVAMLMLLEGCSTSSPVYTDLQSYAKTRLPPADVSLSIPGLGPCTDNPDRTLHLNSHQPVTVLVHGCFGSSGRFRGLSQVLAFHGQQAVCFTYNDRDSMMLSSGQLVTALEQLSQQIKNRQVTVIGHSQGALIARKALVSNRPDPLRNSNLQLRLVTVSGPFAGIAAAKQCGNPVMRMLTLGLIGPMCKIITGDKWSEITYTSEFILQPGQLHEQVSEHIKIDTDERGACRKSENGRCIETDDVFSLEEQRNVIVDGDPVADIVEVKAGHVEIVGDAHVAPLKLIDILQKKGILESTEPQRRAHLNLLLTKVYGAAN
jgi:hypothetical protein